MSIESAKELIERIRNDEALAGKFRDAGESGFEAIAKDQGLDVSVDEMRKAMTQGQSETELSEEDLEKVSGAAGVAVFSVAVV